MEYRIIPRAEWGARYDNGSGHRALPATEVWLHHSVTIAPDLIPPFDDDYQAIRDLEQIGEDRFGSGISYTWPITPAGLIFEGHSPDRIGTHTQNHNTVASAICYVGNYEIAAPTVEQTSATAWLLQHAKANGWIKYPQITGGHQDLKATACPGALAYAEIPTINTLAAGPPIVAVEPKKDEEHDMPNGAFEPRLDPAKPGRISIPIPQVGGDTGLRGARLHTSCGWYNELRYKVWFAKHGGGYVSNPGKPVPEEYVTRSDQPGYIAVPINAAQISIEYTTTLDNSLAGWTVELDYA